MTLPNTDQLAPDDRAPVFHVGERVQTIYGAARAGTVVEFRQGPTDRADVRWDDTRNEVCTNIFAGNLAASSIIDALAELVRQPEPPALVRRGIVILLDDTLQGGPAVLTRDAALRLGSAMLGGGEEHGPWW